MADIVIVGGINIDIEGNPFKPLKYQDSNPGKISISYGGVGRNITENVARLGGNVALLSAIGCDHMGRGAVEHLLKLGVDVSMIRQIDNRNTSMYISLLDHNHDMELALSDMEIIEEITPQVIEGNMDKIKEAKVVALDGNLKEDLLGKAVDMLREKDLFYDPVSAMKAVRAKNFVSAFHSIKPNVIEAEVLSGMEIKTMSDVERVAKWFIDKGTKNVYITLNKEGVFYCNENTQGVIRPKEGLRIVSATGAGDSFSATILYGISQGYDIREIARLGMAAAEITMESKSAVNSQMSMNEIKRRMKENV